MKVYSTVFIVLVLFGTALGEETHTITGDIWFQYDGDIYIRICTMKDWSEFLRPNYELSVPPWQIIRLSSEEKQTGKASFTLTGIPSGTYVLVVFQDVIKNRKVDYQGLHMKEPYGTYKEDDYVSGRPRWDYVRFSLNEDLEGIRIQL